MNANTIKVTDKTLEILRKLKSEQGINHNKAIELAVVEKYGNVQENK